LKAALFNSRERFSSFKRTLENKSIEFVVLDFENQEWIEYDYTNVDFLIYYPSFEYSSNHPLALNNVRDNMGHISSTFPHLKMYPDPRGFDFYNDKYKQYLFLRRHAYPMPLTYPLLSERSVDLVDERLGYPIVLKNRYGAGGGFVFKIHSKRDLIKYYRLSRMDLLNLGSVGQVLNMLKQRMFYYHFVKQRKMPYPFMSSPLLAQEFVKLDRDLKLVVGDDKVVEAHWRLQENESQWKVNIDGGGIGQWSHVPESAQELAEQLAKDLRMNWLNIDMILADGRFLITEFSPVWHHYAYKEKPTFVYEDDYNINVPLEVSLDLERIIVDSLIRAAGKKVKTSGDCRS